MDISKVVYGDTTLIDLTEDTVTADSMLSGVTAHGANGEQIYGTMSQVTPATATPLMDGTAAVGTSIKYAREDHVHPHDSSIPTKTSDLTNDSGFITDYVMSDWEEDDSTDPAYIQNKPAIKTGTGTNAVILNDVENNVASGNYSITAGRRNKNTGSASLVTGLGNDSIASRSITTGQLNRNDGGYNLVVGNGSYANASNGISVGGGASRNITISGAANATTYTYTELPSFFNHALTRQLMVVKTSTPYAIALVTLIDTTNNTITLDRTLSETALTNESVGLLIAHNLNNTFSMIVGQSLQTTRNNQMIVGQFNELDSDALFIVGNGDYDLGASNALAVHNDGSAIFGGTVSAGTTQTPASVTANNDLTTKAYVDGAAAGIEAELQDKMPIVTYGTPEVIVDTTTVSFSKDGDNDWYISAADPISGMTFDGNTLYKVTWDDTEYDLYFAHGGLKSSSGNGYYAFRGVGNAAVIGQDNPYGTNAPFIITRGFVQAEPTDSVRVFTLSTEAQHTIKVEAIPYTKTVTAQYLYQDISTSRPAAYIGSGDYSVIFNISGKASGQGSSAFNIGTKATGAGSAAFGGCTEASGMVSHAEGMCTIASGTDSHAEGGRAVASGAHSHAEGDRTTASGYASHAEGHTTTASNNGAHSEGYHSTASGKYSHAGGDYTVANHRDQYVFGQYNIADTSVAAADARGDYVEIVGNGTADDARSNARTLDWSGNEELAGDLTINKGSASEIIVGTAISNLLDGAQSDWAEEDSTDLSYIQNKPPIKAGTGSGALLMGQAALGNQQADVINEASGANSLVLGIGNRAKGASSTVIGQQSEAGEKYSISDGVYIRNDARFSLAMGQDIYANDRYSISIGNGYPYLFKITGAANATTYTYDTLPPQISAEVLDRTLCLGLRIAPYSISLVTAIDVDNHTVTVDRTLSETAISDVNCYIWINHGSTEYYSALIGSALETASDNQLIIGNLNRLNANAAFIIGNGVSDSNGSYPSNSTEILKDGSAWFAGTVSAGTALAPAAVTADNDLTTKKYVDSSTVAKTQAIPYGEVDSTSTSTAYTATVPGITELKNGTCVMLKNGVVTSASGFTIDINGLGAKPVYNSMGTGNDVTPTAPSRETTIFNINYTLLLIYSTDLVDGGAWINYRGYNSDNYTIGYQLRTNNTVMNTADPSRYYRIFFTSADGTHWVPANTAKDNSATSQKTVNQRKINPFGRIIYYSTTTNFSAENGVSAAYCWSQYAFALGYSFNTTGSALTLTAKTPVYIKCAPQTDGSAIIDSTTPYVQALPSTADGKIYIFLGIAYSATNIELYASHPVYYHDGTSIKLWTGKAIPTKTSELTNDSGFLTSAPVTSVNGKTGAVVVSELPSVTSSDNGKVLRVVNGVWAAAQLPSASGVSF